MAWTVEPYSEAALLSLFATDGRDSDLVQNDGHFGYFTEYFASPEIDAKTIVVEDDYVDHDYLDDYSSYYVKCFEVYPRRCKRLHFFATPFGRDELEALLTGSSGNLSEKGLVEAYRGFVVVKPLPHCFVGRTCLKTYSDKNGERHFKAVRPYDVNLLGLKLSVNTLAFGQQDQVVAACATAALWSAFQATSRVFQHYQPSPVEITKAATESHPIRTRVFPHMEGLTLEQMAQAIKAFGLEPLFVDVTRRPELLKQCVFAYLEHRIPVVLGVKIQEPGQPDGYHAVAVSGYSTQKRADGATESDSWVADGITKLYVHDDQVGPYARMEFQGKGGGYWLSTSFGMPDAAAVKAHPVAVLVPLYHKIRLEFSHAVEIANRIETAVVAAFGSSGLRWAVRLTDGARFKRDLRKNAQLSAEQKLQSLARSLPRFLWRVTGFDGDRVALDVAIDATDIEGGRFIEVMIGDGPVIESLRMLADPDVATNLPSEFADASAVSKAVLSKLRSDNGTPGRAALVMRFEGSVP